MPYGSGPVIRHALTNGTPRQRYAIGALMVAAGAVLVAVGHVAGALLAVAGVLLIGRMLRSRLGAGKRAPAPFPDDRAA